MPELEPITREEKFLNGEVGMTPITREEKILAGEDIETVTRREYFLKKYRGGGGGDITVESLSVTSNGTYTAPSGKAYSPVEVDVPLPENAYLLKSVANLPQAIASFNDGEEMVMPTLKVSIEPQQEGSGDPSPTNIRPISGWSEANVVNMSDVTNISYFQGLLNGTYGFANLADLNWTSVTNTTHTFYTTDIGTTPVGFICSKYTPVIPQVINDSSEDKIIGFANTGTRGLRFHDSEVDGTNLSVKLNGIYIIYELATSTTPTITAEQMNTLLTAFNINGNTYTIDLDGTRYGGELDVINGIGREYKEYPSYNGETLIGPWISDRDAYAEGTTPTIGAQVLDKGDISIFNTIPTAVKSLRGVNNIFANTGDITDAEYFSKEV